MKPMPMDNASEEPKGPDPQQLLDQGKQICMAGEALIQTAKAMGAVDDSEQSDNGDQEGSSDQTDSNEGGEYSGPPGKGAPSPMGMDPRKTAIIAVLRKKLGGK